MNQPDLSPLSSARLAHNDDWRLCPARQNLPRRVRLALDMAEEALSAVIQERSASPSTPRERPLLLQKVVTESALMLRCCAFLGAGDRDGAERNERLVARLAPLARSDRIRASLCREPAHAIEHATAHVILSDLGDTDEAFDRLLAHVLDSDEGAAGDRTAGQDLERHWLLQLRGAATLESAEFELLDRSVAGRPLDVLHASSGDLYDFTHVLMHATDMGQRAVAWPRGHAPLLADAEAAIALALDADNLDLVAEVLWTWPMADLAWTPAAEFAFELLTRVQDEHGYLPGPEHPRGSVSDAERPWSLYVLRTSYHATYAMGLLCAAMLRTRPVTPPKAAAPGMGALKAIELIMQLLDREGRQPRWIKAIGQLAPARRVALAPLLMTAALRRATAVSDFERLRECLRIGLDYDLTDGLAFGQGLRMLERATLFARRWRS